MKKNKVLLLFANCIFVKGVCRSTICDLQRNKYHLVPNSMGDVLQDLSNESFDQIKSKYIDNLNVVEEYIQFIEENELGFWCEKSEKEFFPKLDLKWDYPAVISNAIIDIDRNSNHPFESIFKQLESLGCADIQMRFFDFFSLEEIASILDMLEGLKIQSIEILCKHDNSIKNEDFLSLVKKLPRIKKITIYDRMCDDVIAKEDGILIISTKNRISSQSDCGNICPANFNTSLGFFSEAQTYNTCLNRKISIDIKGELCNCPSLNKRYGNVRNSLLKDVSDRSDFKEVYYLNKDQIEVCKECEFRYICIDCRAFLSDPENKNSKPSKCSYDPYTCQGFN